MKKLLLAFVVVVAAAGAAVYIRFAPFTARGAAVAKSGAAPASGPAIAPAAGPPVAPAVVPAAASADASGASGSPPAAVVDPTGANLSLDDNGGRVERVTGEYGAGVDGRRLIDGKLQPTWSWRGSALRDLPLEIVLSFHNQQPALVAGLALDVPVTDPDGKPNGNAPKDIEVWASMESADTGFQRLVASTLTPGAPLATLTFPTVETRFVKVRILSVQGPLWALSHVDLNEIRVLEPDRRGYDPLTVRYADLPDWRDSPRRAAQRGIDWLQPAAVQWQTDHACFGCHIQAQAAMGLAIAKKHDYVVDHRALKALIDFTEAQQRPDGSYIREDTGEPSTSFAAMGLAYWDDLEAAAPNPKLIKAVDWLLAKQSPAGEIRYPDWLSFGRLAVEQGSMMTTANSLTAFERAFDETHDQRYRDAADRARAWIGAGVPETTQDKVFKILALAQFGGADARPAVRSLAEQLIVEQLPGGGWREAAGTTWNAPNPFSTGQVLYAFKQAGVSITSSPFLKGVKYLLATQSADGSWPADASAFHSMGASHAPTMWAIIALAGSFGPAKTGGLQIVTDQSPEQAAARRNLEIILDLSGSMKLPLGKSTRIATARQVLRDVLAKLPDDFNVGLRVYAHRFSSRQKETCTDTELVSPIAKLDRQRIQSIADRLQPRGETPLVYSILQAPADLKSAGGGSLIVVTDGEETCGGDTTAAAQQLKAAGLPITLNIVGFTLTGKKVEQQLTTFAESTGGRYYSAQDGDTLGRAITTAALARIPYTVYDAKGVEVARGIAGPVGETLQPGTYKVVVQAGEQQLTDSVDVVAGKDLVLKVTQQGGRYQLVGAR